MMNIQRHIRRILREEYTLPNLIRRRFSEEELDKLVSNVKRTFETHRISKQHREDVIDAEVDDFIMNSVYYGEFEDFDDEIYQDIYNQYREPLVDYIKSKIDMNLQESIRKVLREETKLHTYIRRRYDCFEDFINKLENGDIDLPIIRGGRLNWFNYQIILTAYMRAHCGDEGHYNPELHQIMVNFYEPRLYEWFINNI